MSNTRPGVPPRPVPGGRAGDPRGGILPGDAGPAPPRQLPAALRLPALPPQHGQPAQQVPTDPHIFILHLFICLSIYLSIYIYAPIYLSIYLQVPTARQHPDGGHHGPRHRHRHAARPQPPPRPQQGSLRQTEVRT